MTRPDEKRLAKGLWWDKNWGVIEGCSKVSEGCSNCFAEVYAHRFGKSLSYLEGLTDENGHWTGKINFRYDQLKLPLRRKKPTVWFVAERSDLFHEAVPDSFIHEVLDTIGRASWHTFLLLTKRPERMAKVLSDHYADEQINPYTNLCVGTTAENQKQLEERYPRLLQTPAARRFLSIEPMLGPIDLFRGHDYLTEPAKGKAGHPCRKKVIDWVVCGGESGSGARPVHPDWVRSVRDQCQAAGVPFFFKQWGEWVPQREINTIGMLYIHGTGRVYLHWEGEEENDKSRSYENIILTDPDGREEDCIKLGKKTTGRRLDGKEHLGWPE